MEPFLNINLFFKEKERKELDFQSRTSSKVIFLQSKELSFKRKYGRI